MTKTVLIFGLIIGAILCVNMIYMVNVMCTDPDFKGNDIAGYVAMVAVFSLIFFGIKRYRSKQPDRVISFGKAFKVGLLITLVSSTMYVVVWLFYYHLFVPDFLDKYAEYVLKNCAASDLPAKTEEMENIKEMYKNPVWVILLTLMEVFPIGLIVALVSALILKKKKMEA